MGNSPNIARYAMKQKSWKITEMLRDANINNDTYNGKTAFHYAILYGNIELANTLLDNGYNIKVSDVRDIINFNRYEFIKLTNVRIYDVYDIFSKMKITNNKESVDMFMTRLISDHDMHHDFICHVVKENYYHMFNEYLRRHSDCLEYRYNDKYDNNQSYGNLLYVTATVNGSLECLKLMYSHDKSIINHVGYNGRTLLHLAAREFNSCYEYLDSIMKQVQDNDGRYPSHYWEQHQDRIDGYYSD